MEKQISVKLVQLLGSALVLVHIECHQMRTCNSLTALGVRIEERESRWAVVFVFYVGIVLSPS